jgi:hypothetical protein
MPDFAILVGVSKRWPHKLDRPRSNSVCLLTVETDIGYQWVKKNFSEPDGMYLIHRGNVGPLVWKIRSEGMTVRIDKKKG